MLIVTSVCTVLAFKRLNVYHNALTLGFAMTKAQLQAKSFSSVNVKLIVTEINALYKFNKK
jgi:hypothetical protein